jgi:hypothetical protein
MASELVLVPVQPSPYDVRASAGVLLLEKKIRCTATIER